MMENTKKCLIVGLPNAGKSTYIGAFWAIEKMVAQEQLTELRFIFLGYILIEEVRPLADLHNLYSIVPMKTDVDSILPLKELENLNELIVYGNTSNKVKEQAEVYFCEIEHITVTDELPY